MTINPNNGIDNVDNLEFSSQAPIEILKGLGKSMLIGKGKTVINQGDKVDFIFFVESGTFRTYRWIGNEEVTIGFSFRGDIDTCAYAYINQVDSLETVEALADSRITKVYRNEIDYAASKNPQVTKFIQNILSHYIEVLIQRNIDIRTKSAETLYIQLLERQPHELSKIPLMYLASYLGISKERLSRIRKKIALFD